MKPRIDPLARLAGAIRQEQDPALDQLELGTLDASVWVRPGARWRARQWLGLAGWAVAGAAAAAAVLVWWQTRALGFEAQALEQIRDSDAPAWQAPSSNGMLRFSDGSVVEVRQGSRARLDSVQANGAMVRLDQGQLKASIIPRSKSSWRFKAGFFEVWVTGTRFSLALESGTGALTVRMEEGSVRISGCALDELRLAAGQSATLSCDGARPRVNTVEQALPAQSSGAPGDPVPVPPAVAPQGSAPEASARRPGPMGEAPEEPTAPIASSDAAAGAVTWQALASQGKFREAYMAADLAGFDAQCDSLSARELMELADVAQFAGRSDRCMRALLALRKRFPGSGSSATAAFKLGRMAADQRGAVAEARQWFETCLAEAPSGVLAREAMGRLMEMDRAAGNVAGARARAVQYLERYPQGPHAELARTLVGR
ncbi:MAG: FecR domain-containing protein [Deltaproteobacteria bacterium]|nr:FecR domain-containing protein [Deltaproteobacteria bacterium]